jgi:hypothetical protein
MHHRFAVESTASMVAGQIAFMPCAATAGRHRESAANQHKALDALANTLKPRTGGAQAGAGRHSGASAGVRPASGTVPAHDGRAFDPISPATIAADAVGFTLQLTAPRAFGAACVEPARAGGVIDRLKATFDAPAASPYEAEIRRAEERFW